MSILWYAFWNWNSHSAANSSCWELTIQWHFFVSRPFWGLIWIQVDTFWIQVIQMDRAWNSDQLTFLKFENPSTGSKIISLQGRAQFLYKIHFLADSIFKNKSNISQKLRFLGQKFRHHKKKSITLEALDIFSKNPFKSVRNSIEISYYLDPWIWIQKMNLHLDPAK